MPIQILVRDRDNKPVKNVEVMIKWKDGISKVDADGSGSADTKIDGHIEYTQVWNSRTYHHVYTKDVEYIRHKIE